MACCCDACAQWPQQAYSLVGIASVVLHANQIYCVSAKQAVPNRMHSRAVNLVRQFGALQQSEHMVARFRYQGHGVYGSPP
jgi:hypothetical protein